MISKFKFSPRKPSIWQQVVVIPNEVVTQIKYALLRLDSTLLTHLPGNQRATGKIEKWFQFFQSWFCQEYQYENLSLKELDKKFQEFIHFYNNRFHEGIGETPNQRFQRAQDEGKTRFRPLPEDKNLDDIFCLIEKRYLKIKINSGFEPQVKAKMSYLIEENSWTKSSLQAALIFIPGWM